MLANARSAIRRTHPIERRILAATPLLADAWLDEDRPGTARIVMDAVLVRARGEQQGLLDGSVDAAARSDRVQGLIAAALHGGDVARAEIVAAPGGPVLATIHRPGASPAAPEPVAAACVA